jgi:hypothetical protein
MNEFLNRNFPVTNIKATFFIVIICYGLIQLWELKSDLLMHREVCLESSRDNGAISIKGVRYSTASITQKVVVRFNISHTDEFLLMSNGDAEDCFLTSLMKFGLSILFAVMLWRVDLLDPFNPRHLKGFRLAFNLLILLFFLITFKNVWTHQWVNAQIGIQNYRNDVYQYNVGFSNAFYMILIWLMRMIISFYKKGVQNQLELELTV